MNAESVVAQFSRHRQMTEHFCNVMPDEHYDFKPWEKSLSFSALAKHLMVSTDYYLTTAEGETFKPPDRSELPRTPAEIRVFVARKSAEQTERLRQVAGELEREVDVRGKSVKVGVLLAQAREHEAHHKGQLMMMMRMCGVAGDLFYVQR